MSRVNWRGCLMVVAAYVAIGILVVVVMRADPLFIVLWPVAVAIWLFFALFPFKGSHP